MAAHKTRNSICKRPNALFWPQWATVHWHTHPHIDTNIYTYIKIKWILRHASKKGDMNIPARRPSSQHIDKENRGTPEKSHGRLDLNWEE